MVWLTLRQIDGEPLKNRYHWYIKHVNDIFATLLRRKLLFQYWASDPDLSLEEFTEDYVNKFLTTIPILLADNILQHSVASQVLHLINFGDPESIP